MHRCLQKPKELARRLWAVRHASHFVSAAMQCSLPHHKILQSYHNTEQQRFEVLQNPIVCHLSATFWYGGLCPEIALSSYVPQHLALRYGQNVSTALGSFS